LDGEGHQKVQRPLSSRRRHFDRGPQSVRSRIATTQTYESKCGGHGSEEGPRQSRNGEQAALFQRKLRQRLGYGLAELAATR
jgi:hypothetical protein